MQSRRWFFVMAATVFLVPCPSTAQEPLTISGTVADASGAPLEAANVFIQEFSIGTLTNAQGRYVLIVPASRLREGTVALEASQIGYRTGRVDVPLRSGSTTQDFALAVDPLQLEAIVATGQGTQTRRERLASAVSTVKAEDITRSEESNVVAALAGKAPGVQVTSSAGDPGAGAFIQIRGSASITGGSQPLFIVDGTPIDNSSDNTDIQDPPDENGNNGGTAGTVFTNRAADINPNDIDHIEILKGAAATAIYGSRAANGVVLITTKSGRAGATLATLSTSYAIDDVTDLVPLQRSYGQGFDGVFDEGDPFTWGPKLSADTPIYDHAAEVYQTGYHWDSNLSLSGGNERTTYYLSVGRLSQQGVIRGPQSYDRTNVRLKASHAFLDNLDVAGNIAYSTSGGDFVQQGSNISGIQLGALRTPPEFNNLPYIDATTGIQRTYRDPNPVNVTDFHGYDNPFWVAFREPSKSSLGRAFGNISVDYSPMSWLKLTYLIGADYSSDDRLELFPKGSDAYLNGAIARNTVIHSIIDSNLSATVSGTLTPSFTGSLTLGQNLNQTKGQRNGVNGTTVLNNTEETNFAVTNTGNEFKSTTRSDGYFATGELTWLDQLSLNATARVDGSSTFGGKKRFFYPGLGAAWTFTRLLDELPALSFGKVRVSWGVAGRTPPVFSNVSTFNTGFFVDGWVTNGLFSLYNGKEGVFSEPILGNNAIKPERVREFEVGTDLAFFDQRLGVSVTYYDRHTTDAILQVPVPSSTGYFSEYENAASWKNRGWEVQLDLQPIQLSSLAWNVTAQWSRDRSCVTDLAGAEFVVLSGFEDPSADLVGPSADGKCQPFGVIFGSDFVRYGRGSLDQQTNQPIDQPGIAPGTIYVGADGYPQLDPQSRVLGDPNPRWTGSLRNVVTLFNRLTLSGLVDIVAGQKRWNGTKGALTYFGTHASTEPFHGAGVTETFAAYSGQKVAGPGADKEVPFDEIWFSVGIGSGFTGPSSQFMENAGFVKLRDISLSYTLSAALLDRIGFSSAQLTASGRNLVTWTDYTGIDPESNLTGQTIGRGLDYFNNPQTRSFVFTLTLNR